MNLKTVLVLGSTGCIGKAVCEALDEKGIKYLTSSHKPENQDSFQIDLLKRSTWQHLPENLHSCLIAAGAGGLSDCKSSPETTSLLHTQAIADFAKFLNARQVFVISLSTNYVFDASRPGLTVDSPLHPLCEYGRQKAEMEKRVLLLEKTTVVRLTKIFCDNQPLILSWCQALRKGRKIFAAKDARVSPVTGRFIGRALADMLEKPHPGKWQLSASDELSWFEIGKRLAIRCGMDPKKVVPASLCEINPSLEFVPQHGSLEICWPFALTAPPSSEAVEYALENICSQKPENAPASEPVRSRLSK